MASFPLLLPSCFSKGWVVALTVTCGRRPRRLPLLTAPGPAACEGCFSEAPSAVSHQRSAAHIKKPRGLWVQEKTCSVNTQRVCGWTKNTPNLR